MTNSSAATAAPKTLPPLAAPHDAPEHVDDDANPRDAWADGWNACLKYMRRSIPAA